MSRFKSSRRLTVLLIASCGLGVLVAGVFPLGHAAEDVTPAAGIFSGLRRRDRDRNREEEEPKKESGLPLPPGVPIAPPAQRQGMAPIENASTDPVLRRVDEAIRITRRRFLNAENIGDSAQHTPWQIMHGILALRHDLELKTNRGMVNALDWVSQDPVFRGEHWFEATRFGGRAHPFSVPYYFEGHVNQFLALLTMANLPLDHRLKVADGRSITMSDMVRHAQMTVNANEEISWTLWFLTHYIEPDATWVNAQGQRWSMETLVRMQTADEVTRSPCGGTHGLFALSYARNSYLQKFGKLNGPWVEAEQKILNYMEIAKRTQNKDGSFSSKFFREPGFSQDGSERLKSSGHMLEWIMMAARQPQLNENWIRYGVYNVANDLVRFSNQPIDPGPLYHSLHAIVLYRERMSAPRSLGPTEAKPLELAQVPGNAKATAPAEPPKPGVEMKVTPQPMPSEAGPKGTDAPKALSPESPVVTPANPLTESPMPVPMPVAEATTPEIKIPMPSKTDTPEATIGKTAPMPSDVATTTPVTEAPMPVQEPQTSETEKPTTPMPGVASLPDLPRLPAPKEAHMGTKSGPQAKPLAEPNPDDEPIQPLIAEEPKGPPPLKITRRSTDGLSKPTGAARMAPAAPVVTGPTVLAPLPLDPVDVPSP